MFGEISLLVVLQGAALIAAGAVAGYFISLQRFDKQRDKLRDELESTRNEFKQHREQVDNHFLKTGLLFNRLTDNYREIYEHLATGAQSLCSQQADKPQLDQPETRVLPTAAALATSAPADAEEDSELTATHSPHPDIDSVVNAQADNAGGGEREEKTTPAAEVEVATNTHDKPQSAAAEEAPVATDSSAAKPKADDLSALNDKTADDEHLGADAAPAPAMGSEEIVTDRPPTTETSTPVDQHKSSPSIH